MPSGSARVPPKRELARIQQMVLRAALLGEPMPDGGSVRLSDQAFILRHPEIYLLDENLAGTISIEGLPKPVRVLSRQDIRREVKAQGDVAYLTFRPPQPADDGGVWLTLEGKLETSDSNRQSMGLSSVQVELREVNGRWSATGGTRELAG